MHSHDMEKDGERGSPPGLPQFRMTNWFSAPMRSVLKNVRNVHWLTLFPRDAHDGRTLWHRWRQTNFNLQFEQFMQFDDLVWQVRGDHGRVRVGIIDVVMSGIRNELERDARPGPESE